MAITGSAYRAVQGPAPTLEESLDVDLGQIFHENIWRGCLQFREGGDPGGDRDGLETVPLCRLNVVGVVADERDARLPRNESMPSCTPGGYLGQPRTCPAVLGKCANREILAQAGPLYFFPADRRKVAGHKTHRRAPEPQRLEYLVDSCANERAEIRHTACDVTGLAFGENTAQRSPDAALPFTGRPQHDCNKIPIQHA